MNRANCLLALVMLLTAGSGCATIMTPGPDHTQVTSYPPGAQVFLDEQYVGTTPAVVSMDREHSHGRIQIQAQGYQPVLVIRDKAINGWFWANLCLGGIIGMVVDATSGNMYTFDATPISVNLVPVGASPPPPPPPPPPPQYQ